MEFLVQRCVNTVLSTNKETVSSVKIDSRMFRDDYTLLNNIIKQCSRDTINFPVKDMKEYLATLKKILNGKVLLLIINHFEKLITGKLKLDNTGKYKKSKLLFT